jgi:hypothetical protein
MNSPDYLQLLELTDAQAIEAPGAASAAMERFRTFFENLSPEVVREQVDAVYAAEGWLYDTVALHHGIDHIRPYFQSTAERAAGVEVSILSVLTEGKDTYIKWVMDITWSAFKKGQTTRSFGMSHLRFNAEGKVLLHYDFWDSTYGFWEHLPLFGPILRFLKRRVAAQQPKD